MKTAYIDLSCGGLLCTKTDGIEVVNKGDDSGNIVLLVSTQAVDSDGDIVYQGKTKKGPGWVLDTFNKSPVITWQHDLGIPNLSGPKTRAKVKATSDKGRGLHLDPLVFDDGDMFAMDLDGKIRRGVLTESSVGFRVLERENRKNEEGQTTGFHIYGAQLIETAIVNRGANPETEVLAKRMLGRHDVIKDIESGGSAEIEELREELLDMNNRFDIISNAVKSLGDVRDDEAHELLMMSEAKVKTANAINDTAGEILKSLLKVGIAR